MPDTNTNPLAFGQFASIGDFLDSYRIAEKRELAAELEGVNLETKAKKLGKTRSVADVQAVLSKREPDDTDSNGGQHYRLLIVITTVTKADQPVKGDIAACIATKRKVFVAIRFGDAMGIQEPIKGLEVGAILHLKGEWITQEKARSHGGEKMSVLHFTHHPLGFICTPVTCYS
jgi:endonuclease G, mitochondrial